MPDLPTASTGRRDTDELEITPEMIEAGVVALRAVGVTEATFSEIAEATYIAMTRTKQARSRAACLISEP